MSGRPIAFGVVIGQPPTGSGVVTQLIDFRVPQATAGLDRRRLNQVLDEWCMPHHALFPTSPGDGVVKVSRHLDEQGLWTWLGFYRNANFPRNPRANTVVGYGYLILDAQPDVRPCLLALTTNVDWMRNDSNSDQSAAMIARRLDHGDGVPPCMAFSGSGLGATGENLYLDTSGTTDHTERFELMVGQVEAALSQPAFAVAKQLVIGSSEALASAARRYLSEYTLIDTRGAIVESRQPAVVGQPISALRRKAVAASSPHLPGRVPASGQPEFGPSRHETLSLRSLDLRVQALERADQYRESSWRRTPDRTRNPFPWFQTLVVGLMVTLTVLISIPVAREVLQWMTVDSSPLDISDVQEPETACLEANLDTRSDSGRADQGTELQCLRGILGPELERYEAVQAALTRREDDND